MKRLTMVLVAAVLATTLSCKNNENSSNEAAKEENKEKFDSTDIKRDASFAVKAASGGMMEVELGNLAMTNGSTQQVKDFGQSMVADHSKANEELKALAASKNISLPTMPNADMQKKIDDLKQKQGRDFDNAYIDLMVDDHNEDIDDFQKEGDKGNDADLKSWAAGKVPVLQHHLQMAKDAQNALKK
jgi:putative membrane protein